MVPPVLTCMGSVRLGEAGGERKVEKCLKQIDDHGLMAQEKVTRNIHAKDQSHMAVWLGYRMIRFASGCDVEEGKTRGRGSSRKLTRTIFRHALNNSN